MAHQNHPHLRDDDPMDPRKFKESFTQASHEQNKMLEFDHEYSVSQTLEPIQKDLGIYVMEDLEPSPSATSSSFPIVGQTIDHLVSRPSGSDQNKPQLWKDLIREVDPDDPPVKEMPAKTSLGSNELESEIVGEHEEQTQDLNAAIINSNPSRSVSTTRSPTDNSSDTISSPNPLVNPGRLNVPPMSPDGDNSIINMPTTLSASPPPHEDNNNKLGFTAFAVEPVGALTNLAVSSEAKHDRVLIYVVVACSALAFSISSTALILHKKRAQIAKKMQKAAFVIGTFGFMGIVGMLLPPTISWCFTISAFFLCLLMFAVASLIE